MEASVRRFELRDAPKQKWSNVVLEGSRVTIYSGLIGSGPPRLGSIGAKEWKKNIATEEKAALVADKKCRELHKKGYVEICAELPAGASGAKDSLHKAWDRIEKWFCRHTPAWCEFPLAAGASEEDIQKLEELLGLHLPKDFRDSYRRHNGSNRVPIFGIFALGYWMPIFQPKHFRLFNSVAQTWEGMTQGLQEGWFDDSGFVSKPKGPIKTDHWNPKWIPFTCDDSGDFLCLDLDPPKEGKKGQIIFWWHELGAQAVVAESFQELVCRLADKLEAGTYDFGENIKDGDELYCTHQVHRNFDALLEVFKKD